VKKDSKIVRAAYWANWGSPRRAIRESQLEQSKKCHLRENFEASIRSAMLSIFALLG